MIGLCIWIIGLMAGCEAPAPSLDLVVAGVSTYTIVIPDDPLPADKAGATVLTQYLERISGAKLPIMSESAFRKEGATAGSKADAGPQRAAIYLGRTTAGEAAYDFTKIKDDGFFIATGHTGASGLAGGGVPASIYLAGAHGRSTVYAVYDFLDRYLGCKKFSAGPSYVPKSLTIRLNEGIYDLQNPAFRYRQSYYPMSRDPEYLEWHHLHQFEDLWGVWGHSYFKFVPPKEYFPVHPEYFALVKGKRKPTQLCLSNEAVFKLTVEYLKKKMATNPDALYWSISPEDDIGYCSCDLCRKTDAEEGGPQGSLIRFVNRVAAQFPDKIITTLAYGYTSHPPLKTKPASNVYVMLSSIAVMRDKPFEQAPSAAGFRADLNGWAGLTSQLFVWDYTTQFTNYLAPFPDYANLQPNLQYLKTHMVQGVFEQGSGESYGDMSEYNSYIQAALLWNPSADIHLLTQTFCNGFYGTAGPFLIEYLETMGAVVRAGGKPLDIYGNPVNAYNGFLTPEAIDKYSTLLDKAEAAVENDPVFLARVSTARLPLEYTVLQQSRFYGLEQHGYLVAAGAVSTAGTASTGTASAGTMSLDPATAGTNGALVTANFVVNPRWPARVERFVAECQKSGITEMSEGGAGPEAYEAEWKDIFARGWIKNNALQAKVTLVNPYVEDYPAKGAQTLTDGVQGYRDFSYNWLCFYGVDMVATLDLGDAHPLSQVHLHFLNDPRHWIFLPKTVKVEVSADGTHYTSLGDHTFPDPPEDYTVSLDERSFTASPGVKARYVRVTATTLSSLPEWRERDNKKPMICTDEVYVDF